MICRSKELTDWEKHAEPAGYRAGKLAKRLSVSPRTLRRRIQNTGARPLRKTLRALRLQRALALLAEGKNVNQAADATGYSHAANFTRAFERFFGVPPSECHRLPPSQHN